MIAVLSVDHQQSIKILSIHFNLQLCEHVWYKWTSNLKFKVKKEICEILTL